MNKNELKYIQSFAHKKHWAQESVFIAEGPKIISELLLSNWEVQKIYATKDWIDKQRQLPAVYEEVAAADLDRMSQLQHPNQVIALVKKVEHTRPIVFENKLILVMDGIQDPGNFGTIIRTADWFGIEQIIVSEDTAGLYNPKVIQSTMGSFLRVRVEVMDLENLFVKTSLPTYGAVLAGTPIGSANLGGSGLVVIGNESRGIRQPVLDYIKHPITIPRLGHAESLNAAVATGIILANWKQK